MAAIKGTVTAVKLSTTTIDLIQSSSLNWTFGNVDTTSLGDTTKESIATIKDWTLSISGLFDPDDTAQASLLSEFTSGDGAIADIRFYLDTSYFYGACTCESFSISTSTDGAVTLSASFKANGALTWSP